jgi:hypothetical protein
MRIVNGHVGGVEAFDHFHPFYERRPGFASITRFVHAAARHAEIKMGGIARVDDDRVHFWSVGRAILYAAHPRAVLRIVVDHGERFPGDAAIVGAEQSLRRGAAYHASVRSRVARREPV